MLVAVSIPIFTSQLEKSREATDLANIRFAYAAVMAAGLTETPNSDITKQNTDKITYSSSGTGSTYTASASVELVQTDLSKWQSDDVSVGGITLDKPASPVTITYSAASDTRRAIIKRRTGW